MSSFSREDDSLKGPGGQALLVNCLKAGLQTLSVLIHLLSAPLLTIVPQDLPLRSQGEVIVSELVPRKV